MPKRYGTLTLDKTPEQLFTQWQSEGRIPETYKSWQDLEADFAARVESGVSEKEAREAMGVTYRNIDGQSILQKNVASDGSTRYLNKRAIRVDFNVSAEQFLRDTQGPTAVLNHKQGIKTDWQQLAAFEAQQAGRETGKQFHRGHVVAGLEGGSLGLDNMWPEHGARNVAHGSLPRLPMDIIEDLDIPKDDLELVVKKMLESEGVYSPRLMNELMIGADENMVDLSPKDLIKRGYPEYLRNDAAGIRPETLEATQRRLDDLQAQGINPQAIHDWAANQTATLSKGDAVAQSGPVKTIQPARPTVTVVEPGKRRPQTRRALPSTNLSPDYQKPIPANHIPDPNNYIGSGRMTFRLGPKAGKALRTVGQVAGMAGAVLPIFDAADVYAGTTGALDTKQSQAQRTSRTLQGISGATGLASLNPALTPVTAPVSAVTGLTSAALDRRIEMDKPKPKPNLYGTGRPAEIKPVDRKSVPPIQSTPKKQQDPLKIIGNEIMYGLKQLGINL